MYKEIGIRLRTAREGSGLSVPQLAKKSNVSKSVISNYENGAVQDPSVITLDILGKVLKVPLNWLCYGSLMDNSRLDIELDEYFLRCKSLPVKERRYVLETMKRIITLAQVSEAMNSLRTHVVEDYSMP